MQRALDIWERALGKDHPSLSAALDGLGDGLLAKGDPRAALPHYERAVALLEKAVGPTHPDLAEGLTGEGLALIGLGQARRAAPLLERSLEIRLANPGPRLDLARTQFALARALADGGGDRVRALDLAERASAAYAADGHRAREVDEITAWLAQHR